MTWNLLKNRGGHIAKRKLFRGRSAIVKPADLYMDVRYFIGRYANLRGLMCLFSEM